MSLRGTKQSRAFKAAYFSPSDCFTVFAMTNDTNKNKSEIEHSKFEI
jgi:hypothetical protein